MDDRVAIITDIHANLPALEASLTHIEKLGIHAENVARELAGAGLPAEFADKLVAAA